MTPLEQALSDQIVVIDKMIATYNGFGLTKIVDASDNEVSPFTGVLEDAKLALASGDTRWQLITLLKLKELGVYL